MHAQAILDAVTDGKRQTEGEDPGQGHEIVIGANLFDNADAGGQAESNEDCGAHNHRNGDGQDDGAAGFEIAIAGRHAGCSTIVPEGADGG